MDVALDISGNTVVKAPTCLLKSFDSILLLVGSY